MVYSPDLLELSLLLPELSLLLLAPEDSLLVLGPSLLLPELLLSLEELELPAPSDVLALVVEDSLPSVLSGRFSPEGDL